MLSPRGGPGKFRDLTLSVFPAAVSGHLRLRVDPGLDFRLADHQSSLLAFVESDLWSRTSDVCPSCVVSRDRVPYQRDCGASACRTSPPSGETAPLLPRAPHHRGLGGPAANTASLRCPGVLLRALAAQVGVTLLPLFPTPWASLSLREAQSTVWHAAWPWPRGPATNRGVHQIMPGQPRGGAPLRPGQETGLVTLVRDRARSPAPEGPPFSI